MATECTYKYLPPERLSVLDDGLLRFTPPAALNDPFECIPIISVSETQEVFEAFLAEQEQSLQSAPRHARRAFRAKKSALKAKFAANENSLRDYFFSGAEKNLNSKIGILSLSRRWDSSLMWAHYAQSHTGFCLGLDHQHPFFRQSESDAEMLFRDVTYSVDRIRVSKTRGIPTDMAVMFTKSRDWQYEEEQRMLRMLEGATRILEGEPYPIHLFEVPSEAVVEVILGARATEEFEAQVVARCRKRRLPVYRATPSSASFDMLRDELP